MIVGEKNSAILLDLFWQTFIKNYAKVMKTADRLKKNPQDSGSIQ